MTFADRVTNLTAEGAYRMLARAQALEAAGRHIIHLGNINAKVDVMELSRKRIR